MSALAMTLYTWDGETATVNLWALVLVVGVIGMTWSLFK